MQKPNTRDKILESALSLMCERGYDSVSVQDVCADAKLSKGAFYHYFDSKQTMFEQMIAEWLQMLVANFGIVNQPGLKTDENLLTIAEGLQTVFDWAPRAFPILVDYWRHSYQAKANSENYTEPYDYILVFFTRLIEQGKRDGSFRADMNTKTAANLLAAVAMGYLLEAALGYQKPDWSQELARGLKLIFDGMRGEP